MPLLIDSTHTTSMNVQSTISMREDFVRLSMEACLLHFWRYGGLNYCCLQMLGFPSILQVEDTLLQCNELAPLLPQLFLIAFSHHVHKRFSLILWSTL